MSISKYLTSNKTSTGKEDDSIFPSLESSDVSSKEYENIVETIKPAEKTKIITYKDDNGKMKIIKYANLYGIANAVRRYTKEFPNISESTICGLLKKFCGKLTREVPNEEVVISKKREQPLYMPEELDEKLPTSNFSDCTNESCRNINHRTVYGVLMGLIKGNLHLYGGYLEFTATDGWQYSLYERMNFV